jgi:hypothetical protein
MVGSGKVNAIAWRLIVDAGLIGGILGTVLGIAGGAFGTYCSITNTKGPTERSFMVRAAVVTWLALTVFLGLLFVLPNPYRYLLWIPYGILLPLGIMRINSRVAEIRQTESPGRA